MMVVPRCQKGFAKLPACRRREIARQASNTRWETARRAAAARTAPARDRAPGSDQFSR